MTRFIRAKASGGRPEFRGCSVAENGAVLAFPNGYSRLVRKAAPQELLDEFRRRRIEFTAGQCVLEADAGFAAEILAVIRELQLPFVLLFNRSRLMVLPQGDSKSVGRRHALTVLHLSPHNAIAIGDAENDHDLLAACEFGVAVGWGSPALCNVADHVLRGDGPEVVAGFIRQVASEVRLPPSRMYRYQVATTEDGRAVALGVSGRNLLVSGDPRSGKSWITALICEKLILGETQAAITRHREAVFQRLKPRQLVPKGNAPHPFSFLLVLHGEDRAHCVGNYLMGGGTLQMCRGAEAAGSIANAEHD